MTAITHDDLIALAEAEPGPGSKTYELIPMAVKLLLPDVAFTEIWRYIHAQAYTEACIALMKEALPGWDRESLVCGSYSFAEVTVFKGDENKRFLAFDKGGCEPRAFLLAILRAHREVAG